MFDLIVLSEQRKFLSRAKLSTSQDVAHRLLLLLGQPVVGSVTIKRVQEKSPSPSLRTPENSSP